MEPVNGVKAAEGIDGFTVRLLAAEVPQLLLAVTEMTPLWLPKFSTMELLPCPETKVAPGGMLQV